MSDFGKRPGVRRWIAAAALCLWVFQCWTPPLFASGDRAENIRFREGGKDAIAIASPAGDPVFAANPATPLIPASIIKLLSALVAMDTLGGAYRFPTEFYRNGTDDLTVRGYGDPLFVSEAIAEAAATLAAAGHRRFNNLFLDATYFAEPLTIPGVSDTSNPYDAPNGALCANFNTVFYRHTGDSVVSAEPQTPLLPFARERIGRRGGPHADRVVLSHSGDDATLYAGHLIAYFIAQEGIPIDGSIRMAPASAPAGHLIMRVSSPYPLGDVVSRMMEFSNNFIANQLLIAAGAARYGPPGTLDKAVALAGRFARDRLQLSTLKLEEGSGISRRNRISARDFMKVLQAFESHAGLLKQTGGEHFKTGTLHGIQTRAGYLETDAGLYRYVVILNSGAHRMHRVMPVVRQLVADHSAKKQ